MTIKSLPLHANGHRVTGHLGDDTVKVADSSAGIPFMVSHLFDCQYCGEYFSPRLEDDGAYINDPCGVPAEGITTTITLKVPSGKIVVTDDLRPVYDGFDHDGFASYNSRLGQAQVIESFAKQGCAFGWVSNTCPGLYETGEGQYVIATPEYSEEMDEADPAPQPGWRLLASICTDLWAYSVADWGDWVARGGDAKMLASDAEVVSVPAGTYEFTHHTGERGFDSHSQGTVIFAHVRRIA